MQSADAARSWLLLGRPRWRCQVQPVVGRADPAVARGVVAETVTGGPPGRRGSDRRVGAPGRKLSAVCLDVVAFSVVPSSATWPSRASPSRNARITVSWKTAANAAAVSRRNRATVRSFGRPPPARDTNVASWRASRASVRADRTPCS